MIRLLGFNPPSSGSFPKAPSGIYRVIGASQFQSSFIWIIPESADVIPGGVRYMVFQSSFIWIIPESYPTLRTPAPGGGFNPPSSGSFPKAPTDPAEVTVRQLFQSSFIWIIPESHRGAARRL